MAEGSSESTEVVEVVLPNRAVVLARVHRVKGGGAEKVGWQDRFAFDDVAAAIEGVTDAVRAAVTKATPDKLSVTVGFELAVRAGKLTALLVEGAAKATVAVTVEWQPGSPDGNQ
jgi:hypothetical protein